MVYKGDNFLKMLITFERKVAQRSDKYQKDPESKDYLSSLLFTIEGAGIRLFLNQPSHLLSEAIETLKENL